ncbi:Gfo/Idh/MocA family protein [Rubellimicrobium aerolatum]|uniref:Gfo/Idh/MocA family protein n=1 Tax=Rubellimicrobium aerolatum TaxID=490979 RepID=A0ABW0SEA7_9RHOB|nr:Gfo/Idh/MocA family oxidoreductase [Rubellimicrobium aerolatum]MBP1806808.1 putative dehydrogenase [Rubellimicrobium aerolatum]
MIRIGVVGYGYWGPNIARAASELENAQVGAIADLSAPALDRAGRRHPSASLVQDWRDLVADTAIDAVIVATPVETHFDIAMAALKAGKHVLVEKPMAETPAKAAALVDEAARRQKILMVDHTFVYTPAIQAIRGMIDAGDIGDIYYYDSTRINLGLFQRDVNVIWDLAVHDFAIMDHLLDSKAAAISATAAAFLPNSPENMAHLTVYHENGALSHLNVNWMSPVKIRQTLIGGSRRMVIYDDMQTSEKVKVYDRGASMEDAYERRVNYRLGDMWAPALSSKEALLTEMQEFVRCIETGARPLTDGEGGLRVVKLLDAASRSTRLRGQPIELFALREAS